MDYSKPLEEIGGVQLFFKLAQVSVLEFINPGYVRVAEEPVPEMKNVWDVFYYISSEFKVDECLRELVENIYSTIMAVKVGDLKPVTLRSTKDDEIFELCEDSEKIITFNCFDEKTIKEIEESSKRRVYSFNPFEQVSEV